MYHEGESISVGSVEVKLKEMDVGFVVLYVGVFPICNAVEIVTDIDIVYLGVSYYVRNQDLVQEIHVVAGSIKYGCVELAGVGESYDWDVERALREIPTFDLGDCVEWVIGALSSVKDVEQIRSECSTGQRIHHVVAE